MTSFFDRLKRMLIVALKQLQDPYYHGFAAQISFYLILSIVPFILLLTQILGMLDINLETALSLIQDYTGYRISGVIAALFEFNSIGAGNIFYFIVALWAGSRASFCISRIANYTLTEGKTTGRNYFVERARAILIMLLTVITLVLTIFILCYGKIILIGVLNLLRIDAAAYVDSFWMWIRWPLGFILYLLMISFNYYILPTKRPKFTSIIPGALFAAFGMLFVTAMYSAYSTSLVNYDIMYGTLSSVVAILVWFLLISWVIILGVLVNKVTADTSVPFSKRNLPEHAKKDFRRSKYDADPSEIGIWTIKDIITGVDAAKNNPYDHQNDGK